MLDRDFLHEKNNGTGEGAAYTCVARDIYLPFVSFRFALVAWFAEPVFCEDFPNDNDYMYVTHRLHRLSECQSDRGMIGGRFF